MRKVLKCFGVLMAAGGFLLLLQPFWQAYCYQRASSAAISDFCRQAEEIPGQEADTGAGQPDYRALYGQMQEYNARIFAENQKELRDAFSYTTNSFDFRAEGLNDDMAGYLEIPAMDLEIPLYIGANAENMAKGATVLNQTSMPIGGTDTNCVIAAHRGWRGTPMFREIERLAPGDEVTVTNLWETLTYTVWKCIVIDPYDIDKVKIIPGQDMLTLITCHPYTQNYQRYVVYCTRSQAESQAEETIPAQQLPEGVGYTPSGAAILRERMLFAGALLLLAAAIVWLAVRKRRHR